MPVGLNQQVFFIIYLPNKDKRRKLVYNIYFVANYSLNLGKYRSMINLELFMKIEAPPNGLIEKELHKLME